MVVLGINTAENNQTYCYATRTLMEIPEADEPLFMAGAIGPALENGVMIVTLYGDDNGYQPYGSVNAVSGATNRLRPVISVDLSDYTLSSN